MKQEVSSKQALPPAQVFEFEAVTLNRHGEVTQRQTGQAQQVMESLGAGAALELVQVPGGSFQMGLRQEGGYEDERPLHPVFLAGFWLGKHPVTQAQWRAVTGSLPDCRFQGDNLPVDTICWKDAAAFCERLSRLTGRRYCLPSEAQWEYACRAGTSTPFSTGETITTDFANFVGDHIYRDAPTGIYRHGPTPGGTFPPNLWGIYDMHGNMWEFCADHWHPDYSGARVDGSAWLSGRLPGKGEVRSRVARGGSWHETPLHCRSAVRLQVSEDERLEYYGVRVMLLE